MFSNQVTVSGKHMICDIKNIKNMDILNDINKIKTMFDTICETHHFTILNKVEHKFEPQGLTMIYLLAESHISIHTFPERQYAAVDIYTCHEYENNKAYESIYDYLIGALDASKETPIIIDRTMV